MKTIKTPLYNLFIALFIGSLLWLSISILITAFKCPKMTNTELIINAPNSFMLDFECKK